MTSIKFTIRQDAHTFVQNAGYECWDWNDGASAEGFADWLYENRDGASEDCRDELREYLESVGDNPEDYGI